MEMHIINYTEGIFKDMSLKGADNAFCYATGLMTSQKKHGKDYIKARFGNLSEILLRIAKKVI
jgi:hypothetical protein